MVRWTTLAFILAVGSGCGGGDDDADGRVADPGPASTTSNSSNSAVPWPGFDDPVAAADEAALDREPAPPPDSREVTTAVEINGSIGDPTEADADPCRLVPVAEWAAWLGQPGATADELEDGTVCGYRGGDDTVRMAIGVLPLAGSSGRFLPPDTQGAAQSLKSTTVSRTRWIERYPIADSSVLVAEGDAFDLVVEMSTRGSRRQDELRLAAIAFAEGALGRMP